MPLAGGQGGLVSSVNPITTRGADYTHHITASPPGFENPAASLQYESFQYAKKGQHRGYRRYKNSNTVRYS